MAKYILVPSNLFELPQIKLVLSKEYGDKMFLVWLELVLKSKRTKGRRFIWKIANGIELTDDVLAHIFEVDTKGVFDELEMLGFIERGHDYLEVFRVWEDEQRNRNTPEYRQWRKAVFERDNYTCQRCGVKGGSLEAHHKIPWIKDKELRFDVDNGLTLCVDCHKKIPRRRRNG